MSRYVWKTGFCDNCGTSGNGSGVLGWCGGQVVVTTNGVLDDGTKSEGVCSIGLFRPLYHRSCTDH